ncbi:MAG: hypothetical protein KDB03_04915 [Planctomycetales bacterium]|nr:hypothetical protein [Planctomycetales bacterium]
MRQKILPPNVTGSISGAPQDSLKSSATSPLSLRFPVHNHRQSLFQDILVGSAAIVLISGLAVQNLFFYSKHWQLDASTLNYSVVPYLGFVLLFIKQASRNWISFVLFLILAALVNVLAFAFNRWVYHWAIGLIALAYFLDQFILHSIYLRFNAVNATDEYAVNAVLRNRFGLNDQKPIGLLSYAFPIVILGVLSFGARSNLDRELEIANQVTSKSLAVTQVGYLNPSYSIAELSFFLLLVTFLVLLPTVLDYAARLLSLPSFGPRTLFTEYQANLKSWFTYNSANSIHPGVLQSPCGNSIQRKLMFLGAMLFLVPIAMPTQLLNLQIDERQKGRTIPLRRDLEEYEMRSEIPPRRTARLISFAQNSDRSFTSDALTIETSKENPAKLPQDQRQRTQRNSRLEDRTESLWDKHLTPHSENPLYVLLGLPNLVVWILGPLMPGLVLLGVVFAATARSMAMATEELGPLPNADCLKAQNWQRIVSSVRRENPTDIFWGVDARDQTPIIIPQSVLREHVHFLGDTGSGKTSLGIAPLVSQLVEGQDASVLVIDLKGDDQSLFELLRAGASRNSGIEPNSLSDSRTWSYPFSYFTTKHGFASHVFNPLLQSAYQELTPVQKADLLTTSLGLQYGTDYGRKYFGDSNVQALLKTLEIHSSIASFVELLPVLKETVQTCLDRETRQAASNLMMSVHRMSTVHSANAVPSHTAQGQDSFIDLIDLFRTPQAVYFSLPSATGSVVNADVGRLVLFALINAAQHAQKPRRQVFLVIDEFQRLVSNQIAVILQMARGLDIGIILSNQGLSDLNQIDAQILPTVTTNTRIRQVFGVSDPSEIKQLVDVSGEQSVFLRSFTEAAAFFSLGFLPKSRSYSETVGPRIRTNDIIEASDDPFRSIFTMRRGTANARFRGYPFVMQSCYHITPAEYEQRVLAPWPEPTSSAKIWNADTQKREEQHSETDATEFQTASSVVEQETPARSEKDSPAQSQATLSLIEMLDGLGKKKPPMEDT